MLDWIKKLARELIRRRVLRALGAYLVVVWLLFQGLVDLFPTIGLPEWSIQVFLAITIAATPVVAMIAWKYDLASKGSLRDSAHVAVAHKSSTARAIDRTTRSAPQEHLGRSIVHASWVNEKGEDCEHEFDKAFVIGRDFKADVRMSDDRVSRRHLQVYPVGDDWYVKDLASLNGSYVDGQTIDTRKIESDVDVFLDASGPKIRLAIQVLHDTKLSANSG